MTEPDQIYIAVRTCRLPVTVPFLSLSLALAYVAQYTVKLCYDLIQWDSIFVLDLACLILPVSFVALAGTLPLQRQLSGRNVAENDSVGTDCLSQLSLLKSLEVPSSKLSCPEDKTTLWEWSSFSFVKPLFKITQHRTRKSRQAHSGSNDILTLVSERR